MDKCTVVAKREVQYTGPFGLASWLCGLIFIPRMQSDAAKRIMADAARKIKEEKVFDLCFICVCICGLNK